MFEASILLFLILSFLMAKKMSPKNQCIFNILYKGWMNKNIFAILLNSITFIIVVGFEKFFLKLNFLSVKYINICLKIIYIIYKIY